eukprot:7831025-Pyramimonas_sp.AAC.1
MQVSRRLLTAPECSACLSKREWPRRAPAPATRLAMGASEYQCRAAMHNRCSKFKIIRLLSSIIHFRWCPCASGGVHFAPSS